MKKHNLMGAPAETLRINSNPLLARPRTHKRELRDLRRRQTAAQAIDGLKPGLELYGFSKGQFSMLDLIVAL